MTFGNVEIESGSGVKPGVDTVATISYERVKLMSGLEGETEPYGDTDLGSARALWVDPRPKAYRQTQTPTVSTSPAYTAKDNVGGLMTFTNAARFSGGSFVLDSVQLYDASQQMKAIDLILFDRTLTAPTDNAIFDPTDTELKTIIGVIPITPGDYADFNDNSVAERDGLNKRLVLNGTSLFVVMVARGTPTYVATSDLTLAINGTQD